MERTEVGREADIFNIHHQFSRFWTLCCEVCEVVRCRMLSFFSRDFLVEGGLAAGGRCSPLKPRLMKTNNWVTAYIAGMANMRSYSSFLSLVSSPLGQIKGKPNSCLEKM